MSCSYEKKKLPEPNRSFVVLTNLGSRDLILCWAADERVPPEASGSAATCESRNFGCDAGLVKAVPAISGLGAMPKFLRCPSVQPRRENQPPANLP